MFDGNRSALFHIDTVLDLQPVSVSMPGLPPRAVKTSFTERSCSKAMSFLISNLLTLQATKNIATKKLETGNIIVPMNGTETGGRFAPTAIRMRVVRRASAYPRPEDFCKFLGITRTRLSNAENGFPISTGLARIVVTKMPWISLDWLLFGKEDGLAGAVLQRLLPLVAEESDTTMPRSRSKSASGR